MKKEIFRRGLAFILVTVMLFTANGVNALVSVNVSNAANEPATITKGDGSVDNPYQIYNES